MTRKAFQVDLDLHVDEPFHVVSARLTEGISRITTARLEIASAEDLDLEKALTQEGTVHFITEGTEARRWTLSVVSVSFLGAEEDTLRYEVELASRLEMLRLARNTRKFRKLSAKDIVSRLLDEGSVKHEWRLTRDTPRRNYCAQYRETNLDFVLRLLEFEGIYYTFEDDGTMVLADASSASPRVEGTSHFELVESAGALEHAVEGIFEIRRGSAAASGMATVTDFDWKKPSTSLLQTASAERDAHLEVYDYPTGFRNVEDGAFLARIRLEALRVPARYVAGQSSVFRFGPARLFDFGAFTGAAFADEYLLVEVTHKHDNPAFHAGSGGAGGTHVSVYENEFRAIPSSVPFRPAVVTPRPKIGGFHTAMVRGPVGQEIHTDSMGRFRAQFHWDREAVGTDDDSRWLRMAQESASSLFLARIGWEVNVAYIDGDPDRPIGLARDINGVMMPTYAQPSQKNVMTIKTPTSPATGGYNEIKLDDSSGQMLFNMRAERDLVGHVLNDRTETIGRDETHTVYGVLMQGVDRHQFVNIAASSSTTTVGTHELGVVGSRSKSVGGDESLNVAKGVIQSVAQHDKETVGAVRLTVAGSVGLPDLVDMAKTSVRAALQMAGDHAKTLGGVALKGSGLAALTNVGGSIGSDALADPMGALTQIGSNARQAVGGVNLAGGAQAAKSEFQSMIADPSALAKDVASKMTGGLSDGITADKVLDLVLSGSISREGTDKFTRMVGAAHIAAAKGSIDTQAQYLLTELVGGAKVTVAKNGSVAQSVLGPLATTVGGSVMRKSGGEMSYASVNSSVTVGGAAKLASDTKFEIRSSGKIIIHAETKLRLESGGMTIELTPGAVKLTGDLQLKAGGKITVTGKTDNITG